MKSVIKETNQLTFFVDCMLPDGSWRYGSIGWTQDDAIIVATGFRAEHPDWLVEINPVEKEGL